jgi:hypothetical protein
MAESDTSKPLYRCLVAPLPPAFLDAEPLLPQFAVIAVW